MAKVKKSGNGAYVRIPASVLKAARLNLNEPIDVREESGVIVIEPLRHREYSLKELVDQIKPANLHEGIELGARVGKEVW